MQKGGGVCVSDYLAEVGKDDRGPELFQHTDQLHEELHTQPSTSPNQSIRLPVIYAMAADSHTFRIMPWTNRCSAGSYSLACGERIHR